MKIKKKYKIIGLSIILVILIVCLSYFCFIKFRDKKLNQKLQKNIFDNEINDNEINDNEINDNEINDSEKIDVNQAIFKTIMDLQKENEDVKGWIKINDTNINYPLLQGIDNDYYLNRNYQRNYSSYGSIFIDSNSDLNDVNSNVIIYGHSMNDQEMFQNLLNYVNKEYYDSHKIIEIYTNNEARQYEIVTVFKSRIFYQDEQNVFRYYYYYDLSDEKKYNNFINNSKALELYSTGIYAHYGEQLITLITCEYSQDNGRMVVVAKKIN